MLTFFLYRAILYLSGCALFFGLILKEKIFFQYLRDIGTPKSVYLGEPQNTKKEKKNEKHVQECNTALPDGVGFAVDCILRGTAELYPV
jgi:hypothetical protein